MNYHLTNHAVKRVNERIIKRLGDRIYNLRMFKADLKLAEIWYSTICPDTEYIERRTVKITLSGSKTGTIIVDLIYNSVDNVVITLWPISFRV